jgi:hypothetical protein
MGGRPELAAVAILLGTAFAAVSLMTSGVTERFPAEDTAEPRRRRAALDPAAAAAHQGPSDRRPG